MYHDMLYSYGIFSLQREGVEICRGKRQVSWKSGSNLSFGLLKGGVNISKLCREFGISRPTGYQWLRRYRQAGSIRAVRELSRRPYRSPTRTAFEHEQRVITLRRQHDWGAKKIRELLVREGLDLPVITINRILRRKGLVCPDQSHRPAVKRFERERPNELWQMDFKGDYALRRGRCYPLSILDDHSRFAVGVYALLDQCGETVRMAAWFARLRRMACRRLC